MVWRVAQRLSHCDHARWKGEGTPTLAYVKLSLTAGTGQGMKMQPRARREQEVPFPGGRPDPGHLLSETHGRDGAGITS